MKRFTFSKLIILTILFTAVVSGCKKEVTQTVGTVRISFVNHPSDLAVVIFPVENLNIPIYTKTDPFNGALETELNMGNYYLYCQSGGSNPITYQNIGFQIRAGQTTVIAFDGSNVAHVH